MQWAGCRDEVPGLGSVDVRATGAFKREVDVTEKCRCRQNSVPHGNEAEHRAAHPESVFGVAVTFHHLHHLCTSVTSAIRSRQLSEFDRILSCRL